MTRATFVSRAPSEAWPQGQIVRCKRDRCCASDRSTGRSIACCWTCRSVTAWTGEGLEAIRQIRESAPELPVVVVVADEEQGSIALSAGAQEFVVARHSDGPGVARVIRHSVQRSRAERFWRELALLRSQSAEAARVQRGLIPNLLIDDERVVTRSGYRPGRSPAGARGDFFDVIQVAPSKLNVVLGDVCGHGPYEAALVSSCVLRGGRSYLREFRSCSGW